MTATNPALHRSLAAPSFQHVLIVIAALTAVRIIGLYTSNVDLFFDEAQYWAWSRELAFGYFSKPPLLAWIIAGSDALCGSGEVCVRIASPVFYFGTCLVIYAAANELYGRDVAAWSSLAFAFGTAIAFSSRIISTDVPLLFCWAVALLAYLKLLKTPDWRWTAVLGIALGIGLLAKYAMIYFVLCAICAGYVDRDARAFLTRPQSYAALAIALLIVSPNIYWNFANDFVTVKHTGDNISGGGFRFRPLDPLSFIGAQFAVAGPLIFAGFLFILTKIGRSDIGREDRLMLAFAIPPLALVAALAFVRSPNANWAAPACVSMTILVVAWWLRNDSWRWLWATLGIGIALQAVILIGDANAYRITIPALGNQADVYRRTLGWRPLGDSVAQIAQKAGARTVAVEGRGEVAALIYYLRDRPVRTVTWQAWASPQHHFEMMRSLHDSDKESVLFVSACPYTTRLNRYFAEVTPLGQIAPKSGPSTARYYQTFKLEKRKAEIGHLGACVAP